MKLQDYEKLKKQKAYFPLWFELLNASGFAGVLKDGTIVDRRYYPHAIPVRENKLLGVAKP